MYQSQNKFRRIKTFVIFVGSLGLFTLVSCDRTKEVRVYEEVSREDPRSVAHDHGAHQAQDGHAGMMDMSGQDPHVGLDISGGLPGVESSQSMFQWKTPSKWQEKPGNGIRLATFISDPQEAIECSIILLGGDAGGTEANVARWMNQVQIEVPVAQKFADFLNKQKKITTVGGLNAVLVDLSSLQKKAPAQSPSMAVVIVEVNSATMFVKMMGSKEAVGKNISKLEELAKSIKPTTTSDKN